MKKARKTEKTMEQSQQPKRKAVAEFRYSIIAELTNPYLPHGELVRLMTEKSKRNYDIPFSNKTQMSQATIKKWLLLYRKYGKKGLYPKIRSDAGSCKALSDTEAEGLTRYLQEHPHVTATAAFRLLKKRGTITSHIGTSTLSRFIQISGLSREKRWREHSEERQLKFEFHSPLECVQSDFLHAFGIPDEKGKMRKALLIAFIDDATRRIIYADFSFSEHSLAFEKGLKRILQTHGRIGKCYVDNGATYVSSQTQRICDSINLPIIHSRPRKPAGRGKIERFFRTVRDKFLRPLDPDTIISITQLNSLFRTWVETEYNRVPHRGLEGETPLDQWLSKADLIIPIDPTFDLDTLFMHRITRKVYKDSTFTVHGVMYESPQILIGEKITVMYDPLVDRKLVRILFNGTDHGIARIVDTYANSKIRRNTTTKHPEVVENPKPIFENTSSAKPQEKGGCIFTSLAAADIDIADALNTAKEGRI